MCVARKVQPFLTLRANKMKRGSTSHNAYGTQSTSTHRLRPTDTVTAVVEPNGLWSRTAHFSHLLPAEKSKQSCDCTWDSMSASLLPAAAVAAFSFASADACIVQTSNTRGAEVLK